MKAARLEVNAAIFDQATEVNCGSVFPTAIKGSVQSNCKH